MKQVKHDTVAENSEKWYTSPKVRVVFVKAQHVLCVSPYGNNTEKFTLGDNDYSESYWD